MNLFSDNTELERYLDQADTSLDSFSSTSDYLLEFLKIKAIPIANFEAETSASAKKLVHKVWEKYCAGATHVIESIEIPLGLSSELVLTVEANSEQEYGLSLWEWGVGLTASAYSFDEMAAHLNSGTLLAKLEDTFNFIECGTAYKALNWTWATLKDDQGNSKCPDTAEITQYAFTRIFSAIRDIQLKKLSQYYTSCGGFTTQKIEDLFVLRHEFCSQQYDGVTGQPIYC